MSDPVFHGYIISLMVIQWMLYNSTPLLLLLLVLLYLIWCKISPVGRYSIFSSLGANWNVTLTNIHLKHGIRDISNALSTYDKWHRELHNYPVKMSVYVFLVQWKWNWRFSKRNVTKLWCEWGTKWIPEWTWKYLWNSYKYSVFILIADNINKIKLI